MTKKIVFVLILAAALYSGGVANAQGFPSDTLLEITPDNSQFFGISDVGTTSGIPDSSALGYVWTIDHDIAVCTISVNLENAGGAPDDQVSVELYGYASSSTPGSPISNVLLGLVRVPSEFITGSSQTFTESIGDCIGVPSSTQIGVIVRRTGSLVTKASTEQYTTPIDTNTGDASITGWRYVNGTGWTSYAGTFAVDVDLFGDDAPLDLSLYQSPAAGYDITDVTPELGGVSKLLVDVAAYLFQPSANQINRFNNRRADLETRIPFGWFAQVSSTLSGLENTSTSGTTFYLYASTTATSTSVAFFNASDVESLIPANVLSLIRTVGGVGMWTLFFAWIWSLARKNPETEL